MFKKIKDLLLFIVLAIYIISCGESSEDLTVVLDDKPYIYELEPDSLVSGETAILIISNSEYIDLKNDKVELQNKRASLEQIDDITFSFVVPQISENGFVKVVGRDYETNSIPFYFKKPHIYELEPDSLGPGETAELIIFNSKNIDLTSDNVEIQDKSVNLEQIDDITFSFEVPEISSNGFVKVVGRGYETNSLPFYYKKTYINYLFEKYEKIVINLTIEDLDISRTITSSFLSTDRKMIKCDSLNFEISEDHISITMGDPLKVYQKKVRSEAPCDHYEDITEHFIMDLNANKINFGGDDIFEKNGNIGHRFVGRTVFVESWFFGTLRCLELIDSKNEQLNGTIKIEFLE